MFRSGRVILALLGVGVVAVTVGAAGTQAGPNPSGFTTSVDEMLVPAPGAADTDTKALLSVGDTLPGGYRFEAIPDGISIRPRGEGRLDLYVNHETSTVPFPYIPTSTDPGESQNDFDNAQVSHLVMNQHSQGLLSGKLAITSSEGFQRFCSNYLATAKEGFDRPVLFTNEEAIDWVKRSGQSWPATIGASDARQAGAVVAFEAMTAKHETIWGMGRLNHENDVAVPDYDKPVVLSGDDPFVSNPPQSQVYSYIADDTGSLLKDDGDLYAFVVDDPDHPTVNDYYDFTPGSNMSVSGHFVRVPDFADDPARSIAHGRRSDGTDVVSTDFTVANGYSPAYTPPPNDGTWQRDQNGVGIDGPQWVLEQWGDRNNVFQFVRIEDVAYDKRPGMSNVIYLADSGRGSGAAPNGRIWRMELDPSDPTHVLSLRILVEGDDSALKTLGEIHQPDNLETTANGSLMVMEDPSSGNQFVPADWGLSNATAARVWKVDLTTWDDSVADSPDKDPVAVVDQGLDEESGYDIDPPDNPPIPPPAFPISPGNLGAWEASGIVDVSSVFGEGTFLIDVQAHTLWIDSAAGTGFTYKREGGQLLLLTVDGA